MLLHHTHIHTMLLHVCMVCSTYIPCSTYTPIWYAMVCAMHTGMICPILTYVVCMVHMHGIHGMVLHAWYAISLYPIPLVAYALPTRMVPTHPVWYLLVWYLPMWCPPVWYLLSIHPYVWVPYYHMGCMMYRGKESLMVRNPLFFVFLFLCFSFF